jgi:hypothetical protein
MTKNGSGKNHPVLQQPVSAKRRPLAAGLARAPKPNTLVKHWLLKVSVVPLVGCFLIFDGLNLILSHLGNLAGQIANLCHKGLLLILKAEIREKQSCGRETGCEQQAAKYPINRCHSGVTRMLPNEKS